MEKAMPPDAMVSTDIGNVCSVSNSYLRFDRPQSFFAAMAFGNCGYAFPAAMGAKGGIALAGGGAESTNIILSTTNAKIVDIRRDPMAMLPFCGYHMGDYLAHWLELGARADATKLPRIFFVNWFRRDDDGRFLWPGFGENSRVLKWIFERTDGEGDVRDTPIGRLPHPDSLDVDGLDIDQLANQLQPHARRSACDDLILDQLARDLAQEARRQRIALGAVQTPALGVREIQLRHRPGHADVAQPALLLEALGVLGRHAVREQTLLDTGDENQRKLQPLGGVQRHQLYTVLVLVGLGIAGLERGMREEGIHLG